MPIKVLNIRNSLSGDNSHHLISNHQLHIHDRIIAFYHMYNTPIPPVPLSQPCQNNLLLTFHVAVLTYSDLLLPTCHNRPSSLQSRSLRTVMVWNKSNFSVDFSSLSINHGWWRQHNFKTGCPSNSPKS